MNNREFKYSPKTQLSKGTIKVFAVLSLLLIPLLIISNDFESLLEYCSAIFFPLLMTFSCVFYLGSWADLEIADDGIYVEFLWKNLHVPWSSIVKIKGTGFGFVHTDVVLVGAQHLTVFHRVYSLTIGSLQPGFHIHPHFLQSHELFKLIHEHRLDS
jgi:hypothetical protein